MVLIEDTLLRFFTSDAWVMTVPWAPALGTLFCRRWPPAVSVTAMSSSKPPVRARWL